MPISRMSQVKILSIVVFFVALYSLSCQAPPTPDSFDQFLQQFDSNTRGKARSVWQAIQTKMQQEKIDQAANSSETIPDSVLYKEISAREKEKALQHLKELRMSKQKQQEELFVLENELTKWSRLITETEHKAQLGAVYLKALPIKKAFQQLVNKKQKEVNKLQNEITEIRVNASLAEVSLSFTFQDWITIILYLIFTTILGAALAGKQATIRDFFLGGRKLPWTAVCGSIIATELSAATFLIVPAIVFSKGGDMTYLQLAIGTILARFIIGYFFIPAYYKKEIYSPYDYMGEQLGPRVKNMTSILFLVGAILAQGARLYIAAKALQVITGTDIVKSTIIIGSAAMLWTIVGGITTVIWTDTIQFLLFTVGAIAAVLFVGDAVDGNIITVFKESLAAGKLNMINLNFNPKEAYTLWCGLFATGILTLGSHGTDQLMAQRMFTCKNENDARKAVIWSGASVSLTVLLLFVGAGLFVYYKHIPLTMPEQVIVDNDSMKIFAIFIVRVMPPFLSGLVMASIFAAAISTLESVLAALSQTTISILYKPFIKKDGSEKHYVTASRIIVFLWGILLTAFALYCDTISKAFADLIQFALAMAAYTYGALLGTFLLAFLPTKRDDYGLMWGIPLSMLIVFAFNWHQPLAQFIVFLVCLILVIQAFKYLKNNPAKILYIAIASGIVLVSSLAVIGKSADGMPLFIELAWPWHFPIGAAMTFLVGYSVGNKK